MKTVTMITLMLTGLLVGCSAGPEAAGSKGPSAAEVAAGKALYVRHGCVLCHGPEGHGDGPNAALLRPPPRDYSDPAAYKNGTDIDSIAQTIATGMPAPGGGMPAFPHLSDIDRHRIAAYVVSLQRPEAPGIEVRDARVIEAPPGAPPVVYLTLVNRSDAAATLRAVRSRPASSAELHATESHDGMTGMQRIEKIPVPAGATVRLEPGGYHVMLLHPIRPFRAGEQVRLELEFDTGVRRITAPVVAREETLR